MGGKCLNRTTTPVRDRFLIVHNPDAGTGRRGLLRRVVGALERLGCTVTLAEAANGESGSAMARAAARSGAYDAIVAAGGDGTIRSVAAGLRGTDAPVGLIPLGTGNVMAAEIGLARRPEAIAVCLRDGICVPVQGGMANGTPFFLMAGAGLDAEAVARLDLRLKRRIGKLAYVWPVVRAIFSPAPVITAHLDGAAYSARWAVLCKSGRYAGGFRLSPESCISQPGLIAVLCTARTRVGLILDILMIGIGLAERARNLRFVPFHRAQLSADRQVCGQVDGEAFGTLPLSVQADSGPVRIIFPAAAASVCRANARAAA